MISFVTKIIRPNRVRKLNLKKILDATNKIITAGQKIDISGMKMGTFRRSVVLVLEGMD